jgi:hypothetical protein
MVNNSLTVKPGSHNVIETMLRQVHASEVNGGVDERGVGNRDPGDKPGCELCDRNHLDDEDDGDEYGCKVILKSTGLMFYKQLLVVMISCLIEEAPLYCRLSVCHNLTIELPLFSSIIKQSIMKVINP